MLRWLRWASLGLALLLVLLMTTLALPVRTWRTGELPVAPLPLDKDAARVEPAGRIWVDTDAACGLGSRTDPDDCLALLLLVRSDRAEIVGVSTVFGNAELEETDRVTRALVGKLHANGHEPIPVFRGSADPASGTAPAHSALASALEQAPLTLVALGPLTNVAATLRERPGLTDRVTRIVAVMGRRPGHIFHPAEGTGGGMLFGHGPVFRDLNLDLDREAARAVLGMGIPITLVPYEAAREVTLTSADLDAAAASGAAARWVADRSREWLAFWRSNVGIDGFYPFDLLAAQYVVAPETLACTRAVAWVGADRRLWNLWFRDPDALLIGPVEEQGTDVIYCPATDPSLHRRIVAGLSGIPGPGR